MPRALLARSGGLTVRHSVRLAITRAYDPDRTRQKRDAHAPVLHVVSVPRPHGVSL